MENPAKRRRALIEGIDVVQARIKATRSELRQAPTWFRPGLDPDRLPSDRRDQFEQLNQLVRLGQRDRGLLDRIRDELRIIDLGRFNANRCWKNALDWLNRVETVAELVAGLQRDPRFEIERPRPDLTELQATRVLDIRAGLRGGFTSRDEIEDLGEIDKRLPEDIFYTGCQQRRPLRPRPDIDVLMPVRLETRFDPPTPGLGWRLRLRIVPDDISIDRHDPMLSEPEAKALASLWARSGGDLATVEGQAAWARLVAGHGGRRSAWMVKNFPAPTDGSEWVAPIALRTDPLISSVRGWPAEIEVWIARGGAAPTQEAVLTVDRAQLAFDFPAPDETDRRRWWNSFSKAVDVGLGTTIDLGPGRPDDIDVVYVVGRGSDTPAVLFDAHKEAGALSILPVGTPTNSSDLIATDELPTDPEFWLEQAAGAAVPSPLEGDLSQALLGDPALLAPLPGHDRDDTPISHAMVNATWSVLWHHALADVWGVDVESVQRSGLWASANLAPEGPLPAIRVGDQPYAVLPTTSLSTWRADGADPAIEANLVGALAELRRIGALAAVSRGTVVGADTDQLLSIIGQPASSPDYASRWFVGLEMWNWFMWMFAQGVPWADLAQWWDDMNFTALGLGLTPSRRHVAVFSPGDLEIPLVVPPELPEGVDLPALLDMMASLPPSVFVHGDGLHNILVDGKLPASLLVRLIARAMILTAAEVERTRLKDPNPLIEPLAAPVGDFGRIEALVYQFQDAHLLAGDPASQLYLGARAAVHQLAVFANEPDVLERVMRATLDTAMYRVDPWITGLATRRLRDIEGLQPERRLGIYGWVDQPQPGTPGPIAGSMLLAPGASQAYTAAILRDRSLFDDEPARWHMDIDSAVVQEANRIAAEVRVGSHIKEALGRRVERIVGDRPTIDIMRADFPIRSEHSGRRTCDGESVLAALTGEPHTLPTTVSVQQRARIGELLDVMDAYADLLMAEAVHHVVSGRGETAGAAMDAAAGFNSPPHLDVIKTSRSGRAVNTNLLSAIPAATPIGILTFETGPLSVADPSVAAWIASEVGQADQVAWTWALIDDVTDENNPVSATVRLGDLGLAPIDALALSPEVLGELAAASQGENFRVDRTNPVAPDATYRQAVQRLAVLGRQPAVPADLAPDGQLPDAQAVFDDLVDRYGRMHQVADLLVAQLPVAAASADPAVKQQALRVGHRWGITPLPEAGDVDQQLAAMHSALQARVAAAPSFGDPTLDDAVENLGLPELARAVGAFAGPELQMPILMTSRLDGLPQSLSAVPAATSGMSELDAEWLDVIGGVRDIAGVLSAFQYDAELDATRSAWQAWTNRPGDPWQLAVDPDPAPDDLPDTTRLVALYAPSGLLDGAANSEVAIGLLDSWGETIPTADHTVSVAFGFDAPGARAPQAVLIAVPPDVDQDMTTQSLIDILGETRELARARAARPQDLSALAGAAPLTIFQSQGRGAVDLEP